MPPTLAIIAALPREIAQLVRGERPEPVAQAKGISLYRLSKAVIVTAGMGATRAALAVEAALAAAPITEIMSVGLAGSCIASLRAGSVIVCSHVIDTRTGERYGTSDEQGSILATADEIASVQEKARLAAAYSAAVVDMEAATVARLARAHGLRLRVIKAVSDDHDFELASLGQFEGKYGTFRTGAFALHTALHPSTWSDAMKLGRNGAAALKALDEVLSPLVR
jgi:adenosylhomocysteine nucleosidase